MKEGPLRDAPPTCGGVNRARGQSGACGGAHSRGRRWQLSVGQPGLCCSLTRKPSTSSRLASVSQFWSFTAAAREG